mmetsp:Transcript_21080/g.35370  ORF Transcript_21080/g.35370 Transcript_21080/m.35370 type:complete len:237 (+) Transcript_21080:811-1521(+)
MTASIECPCCFQTLSALRRRSTSQSAFTTRCWYSCKDCFAIIKSFSTSSFSPTFGVTFVVLSLVPLVLPSATAVPDCKSAICLRNLASKAAMSCCAVCSFFSNFSSIAIVWFFRVFSNSAQFRSTVSISKSLSSFDNTGTGITVFINSSSRCRSLNSNAFLRTSSLPFVSIACIRLFIFMHKFINSSLGISCGLPLLFPLSDDEPPVTPDGFKPIPANKLLMFIIYNQSEFYVYVT